MCKKKYNNNTFGVPSMLKAMCFVTTDIARDAQQKRKIACLIVNCPRDPPILITVLTVKPLYMLLTA